MRRLGFMASLLLLLTCRGIMAAESEAHNRWKTTPSPADFLELTAGISAGSPPEAIVARLGEPLKKGPDPRHPDRELWVYFDDGKKLCSIACKTGADAGFDGSAIFVLPGASSPVTATRDAGTEPAEEADPAGIDEVEALALIKDVDSAARAMEVAGVIDNMSEDCIIRLKLSNSTQLKMNRAQYQAYLEQGYRSAIAYQYERNGTRVSIGDDRLTAEVRAYINETIVVSGSPVTSVSEETARLGYRDGKLLITSIDATVLYSR